MNLAAAMFAGDVDPPTTWRALTENSGAHLVDVRTEAEWAFVGAPDLEACAKPLWRIVWKSFPSGDLNPGFFDALAEKIDTHSASEVYFICRSGGRSFDAANQAASRIRPTSPTAFFNVAEGFEGDLNADGRRGSVNGWKVRSLPWRQS